MISFFMSFYGLGSKSTELKVKSFRNTIRELFHSRLLVLSLSHCGREFLLLLLLARPNAIFALPRRPTFRSLPGLRNPICNPFQTLSYIGFAGIYECRECARRRKIKFAPGRLCTCNVLKSFTAAVERTSQSVGRCGRCPDFNSSRAHCAQKFKFMPLSPARREGVN